MVAAGSGDDFVRGDAGDDRLFGGAGVDHLRGDDGNDGLDGGADGPDNCQGDAGTDTATAACEQVSGVP